MANPWASPRTRRVMAERKGVIEARQHFDRGVMLGLGFGVVFGAVFLLFVAGFMHGPQGASTPDSREVRTHESKGLRTLAAQNEARLRMQ